MSTRAMVFIDGTWLSVTANRIADQHGVQGRTGGPLDFGMLPRLCVAEVVAQMEPGTSLDVVRTHYFSSIATNYDAADHDAVQRRSDFFDALRRQHRYEVYRFETDYRGNRVRRSLRPDEVSYEPREKAVDVGLATSLLEMAALSAYDIAIIVCGDRDFVPALQAVRRLGKRVAIVSARGSCPREFSDPNDPLRLRDFNTLWLDDLWPQLVAPNARAVVRLAGESAEAVGATVDAEEAREEAMPELSAINPYADESSAVEQPIAEPVADVPPSTLTDTAVKGAVLDGVVSKVHGNGYGFIRTTGGLSYYFRRASMREPLHFGRLLRGTTTVQFTVDEPASSAGAGRAAQIAVLSGLGAVDAVATATPPRPAPLPPPAVATTALIDDEWDRDPFAKPRARG